MPPDSARSLEVCVDDVAGVLACQEYADRIELCSGLPLGGLTPSPGLIAFARKSKVPVHAMIRPRAGSFIYSPDDVAVMISDIENCRSAGLAGVVFGATTVDRKLDISTLDTLRDAAGELDCTLHRAVDVVSDPLDTVEIAIDLGFTRILTSGGEPKAIDGVETLARMQDIAAGRIAIMVGSGVTAQNVAELAAKTGVLSFHSSCRSPGPQQSELNDFGFEQASPTSTDVAKIRALREQIQALSV